MDKERVKAIALEAGFELKPQPNGSEDLNPYVYHFANGLLAESSKTSPDAANTFRRITRANRLLHDLGGIDVLDALEELKVMRIALHQSLQLQSHYAELLNAHDGSHRIGFKTTEEWLKKIDRGNG